MTIRFGTVTIDWFGGGAVRLVGETGVVIYVDPNQTAESAANVPDGDLVLVTHDHHYEPRSIERVAHDDAIVVLHESIDEADGVVPPSTLPGTVELVAEDETFVLGPLDLSTTPAYNDPDSSSYDELDSTMHQPGAGCGYVVTIDGLTVWWPGDTDSLSVHEELPVDVFMPPIGGGSTMDRHEAASLAAHLEPDLVVPIRYEPDAATNSKMDSAVDTNAIANAFVLDVANRGIPVALDE